MHKEKGISALKSCKTVLWKGVKYSVFSHPYNFVINQHYSSGDGRKRLLQAFLFKTQVYSRGGKGHTWSYQWGSCCTDWWKTTRSLVSLRSSWQPADRWEWETYGDGSPERVALLKWCIYSSIDAYDTRQHRCMRLDRFSWWSISYPPPCFFFLLLFFCQCEFKNKKH